MTPARVGRSLNATAPLLSPLEGPVGALGRSLAVCLGVEEAGWGAGSRIGTATRRLRPQDREARVPREATGSRGSVGDDFLYGFKPGRHGPDAPPLAPASARCRFAPRARRAAGGHCCVEGKWSALTAVALD
jgi:hypothetical protein